MFGGNIKHRSYWLSGRAPDHDLGNPASIPGRDILCFSISLCCFDIFFYPFVSLLVYFSISVYFMYDWGSQCISVSFYCIVFQCISVYFGVFQCISVYFSVFQCISVYFSVWLGISVYFSVSKCPIILQGYVALT